MLRCESCPLRALGVCAKYQANSLVCANCQAHSLLSFQDIIWDSVYKCLVPVNYNYKSIFTEYRDQDFEL